MTAGNRRVAVGAAAVLVVAGVTVLATIGTGGTDSTATDRPPASKRSAAQHPAAQHRAPHTAPERTTSAAAPGSRSGGHPVAGADKAVSEFLALSGTSLHEGKVDQAALGRVARGFVKGELENQAAEFADNGWRQLGSAKVVASHTVRTDRNADPPSVTVEACVDSSGMRVVGPDGHEVPGWAAKPKRAPQLYTMVHTAGGWKVSGHGFPRSPTC